MVWVQRTGKMKGEKWGGGAAKKTDKKVGVHQKWWPGKDHVKELKRTAGGKLKEGGVLQEGGGPCWQETRKKRANPTHGKTERTNEEVTKDGSPINGSLEKDWTDRAGRKKKRKENFGEAKNLKNEGALSQKKNLSTALGDNR